MTIMTGNIILNNLRCYEKNSEMKKEINSYTTEPFL